MAFDLGEALKGVSELGTGREQIEYIRLDLIDEDPNNFYQLSGIEELAANIELCGLQQPIRVRPVPGETERYMIVSGHRRRKAVEMLAQDNPERWGEVPCIVEDDVVSPALQQLRLIYANANTRTMTSSEISEQAVQVEKLLYQLKEEGYEFPGRMRDHVAQAVGASKSKLARLKVIRENLVKDWNGLWRKGKLSEDAAHKLAQRCAEEQQIIFDACSKKNMAEYMQGGHVDAIVSRFKRIKTLSCGDGTPCQNAENKRIKAAQVGRYDYFNCAGCCLQCSKLATCRYACPKLADKVKQVRADNKEQKQKEKETQLKKDQPIIDYIRGVYDRFGRAREAAGVSVEEIYRKQKRFFVPKYEDDHRALEDGSGKVSTNTDLPFGYSFSVGFAKQLCLTADAFACSIDYLLGRTNEPRLADAVAADVQDRARSVSDPAVSHHPCAWYPVSVEPPVGKKLLLLDYHDFADEGVYRGSGLFSGRIDDEEPIRAWCLIPTDKDLESAPAVAPELGTAWNTGKPEAYGTYVAYVKIAGSDKKSLRELLWDGEEWFLFGSRISETAEVCCWTEQPEW